MQTIDPESLTSAIQRTLAAPTYSDKYPKLPEGLKEMDPQTLAEILGLTYRGLVARRGMEFKVIPEANLPKILNDVVGWLHRPKFRSTLFLQGAPGNGKTTVLDAVRTLYYSIGKSTVSCSGPDICEQFKRQFEGLSNKFDLYKEAGYVFIDDLGTEPLKYYLYGKEYTPVQDLLAFRYKFQLTSVISTNIPKSDIWDRYGERIDDRFDEMCFIINFPGPSYRKLIDKPVE